jgi:hypothetical protein
MVTAKHRTIDLLRRRTLHERKHEGLGRELEARQELTVPEIEAAMDDFVGDDLLRLVFIACHPVLSPDARVALTLRLLGGLTTDEIARAFLVAEPTVAQWIVRTKRTLAEARVPFEVPTEEAFVARGRRRGAHQAHPGNRGLAETASRHSTFLAREDAEARMSNSASLEARRPRSDGPGGRSESVAWFRCRERRMTLTRRAPTVAMAPSECGSARGRGAVVRLNGGER